MEYLTFEATIPKGQYGGGSDDNLGHRHLRDREVADDKVIIRLHGDKVEGRYALIQTGGKNWLMHRMKDQSDPNSTRATSTAR